MKPLFCLLLLLASHSYTYIGKNSRTTERFELQNSRSKPVLNPDYNQWLKSTPMGVVRKQSSTAYRNRKNLKISYRLFVDKTEHHLAINNCDTLVIEYCAFKNSTGRSVDLYNCNVVIFRYCFFENDVSGFYANKCSGVRVYGNQFKNMQGPPTNGSSVQFNNVTGRGNIVRSNCIVNFKGQSNPEDNINIYKSHGDYNSPIEIDSNYIWGGGPSQSGGGILLGDAGGSFQRARYNVCINPGQYGIGNAGANNSEISNNVIYQEKEEWTNVGIYTYDGYHIGCNDNTVFKNRVYYVNRKGQLSPSYFPSTKDSCSNTKVKDNQWNDVTLNDQWEPPPSVTLSFRKNGRSKK